MTTIRDQNTTRAANATVDNRASSCGVDERRPEGPEPEGMLFFRIEQCGPPDGGTDRINPSDSRPGRPRQPRFKSFYSGLKPENVLSLPSQPLHIH